MKEIDREKLRILLNKLRKSKELTYDGMESLLGVSACSTILGR